MIGLFNLNLKTMNRHIIIYFCLCSIIIMLNGCQHSNQSSSDIISSWHGKIMKFPKKTEEKIHGKNFKSKIKNPIKIVAHFNSIGCAECKFHMKDWKKLIKNVSTIKNISFLFYVNQKSYTEFEWIIERDSFYHPVFYDKKDSLEILNHLPINKSLNTFLLDEKNKVILIGNPVNNQKMWQLYKREINKLNDIYK